MKGSGGDKQGRSRSPLLQPEAQRFRRASVVVGCFLFVLVFLLSSPHDVAVFDTLIPKASLRTPAAETLHSSSGQEVGNTTIAPETNGVVREAEPEEAEHHESNAASAASTSNSGNRAIPGAAEEAVQDNAVHVTAAATAAQPAMETTSSPQRGLPGNTVIITPRAESVGQRRRPRPPLCDLSGSRADVCDFDGDIRLDANASTFVVVVDDDVPASGGNGTTTEYKVRPYPRKGDVTAMGRVTEITVRATSNAEADAPRCTRTHAAPAVVFSIGGYAGNIFHDFTDVIVPLFGAARLRYRGEEDVQLVVTDANPRWLARYGALLRGLSRHAPLDLAKAAAAGEVHCFARAMVTLRAHRELLIEPEIAGPNELAMPEFTRFLRRALSLPRDAPTRPGNATVKPRLLIISRRGTRRLLNADAVARAADSLGFAASVRELDVSDDVARVGRLINSYDALVGVHGAGLTNMVFLPAGATVVQVVPWGGLRWIARLDFGDPAEAMGFRYVQYEVAVEESTLKDKYPRDHEVFTNPTALHRKGFTFLRHTFLNGQDIVLDVERFRPVLLQVLDNLRQTGSR